MLHQPLEFIFLLLVQTIECGNDKILRHYGNFHCTNSAVDPALHRTYLVPNDMPRRSSVCAVCDVRKINA